MTKEQGFIKKDTLENWNKAKNFVPKENEIIVYIDLKKKKIGDGKTLLNNLPFVDQYDYTVEGSMLIIKNKGGIL